jgi:hypothetical protein
MRTMLLTIMAPSRADRLILTFHVALTGGVFAFLATILLK